MMKHGQAVDEVKIAIGERKPGRILAGNSRLYPLFP